MGALDLHVDLDHNQLNIIAEAKMFIESVFKSHFKDDYFEVKMLRMKSSIEPLYYNICTFLAGTS